MRKSRQSPVASRQKALPHRRVVWRWITNLATGDWRLATAFLLLTACGFQPLHGQHYRTEQAVTLATLDIQVDHTRRGQLLETEITDAINPDYQKAEKLYRLHITLSEEELGLFINPDGTSSRGDFILSSEYRVTRLLDGKEVDSGSIQRVSSYNISQTADYASFVSLEDAKRRAIMELGQDYKFRMANLLARLGKHPR